MSDVHEFPSQHMTGMHGQIGMLALAHFGIDEFFSFAFPSYILKNFLGNIGE